jgi:hypothetical protein
MRCAFHPCAEIVISSKRHGSLDVGCRFDLGHIQRDKTLRTGNGGGIVNVAVAITIFPRWWEGCLSAAQSMPGTQQLTDINIRPGLLCTPEVTGNASNKILNNFYRDTNRVQLPFAS